MQNIHKILIVEDEATSRAHLSYLASKIMKEAEVTAVESFDKSVTYLTTQSPTLALLDINLRAADGFDLIPYINQDVTKVIFITASDTYAVRAFEVNAIDYLLKPISEKRLQEAFEKAFSDSSKLDHSPTSVNKLALNDRILVQRNKEAFFIQLQDVCVIQSDDYYTNLLDKQGRRFLYRRSLKEWINYLPEDCFMQVHRSVIMNLNQIERFQQNNAGGYDIFVKNSTTPFPMSRRYKKVIINRFENQH